MPLQIRFSSVLSAMALLAIIMLCGSATSSGQNSDGDVELHANSHASAASIGLPVYPGATLYKGKDNDSGGDLGLSFGDFHFSLMAINYVTKDSPEQVLNFYRKPLSRYGQVLECDHGKPVGSLTVTRSGLTCDQKDSGDTASDSSSGHEIRAGSPQKFRIVGIDESSHRGSTRFALVYLELPKDSSKKAQ
ncbi:hypothetical protein [Edaphobacter dinghuensis]|uniref:Uncharacterized protein n=2 Tax=Edaphobacter dinghuensis TaxID=1560005 RepID=A0A917HKT1_9BACT|nr:hypothetical protein [Edaphobacter dinghuensis]GGG82180.1 hypothetical protein GCM10011585_27160 [Edaphobacter dinghuensis]